MNSWKVILATLVIFGTGVVTGGLLVSHADSVRAVPAPVPPPLLTQAPTPWAARMQNLLRRMDAQLKLQPDQHARIEQIMFDSQQRTMGLWRPIVPLMNREMRGVRDQIRGALKPAQQRKFDALILPRPAAAPLPRNRTNLSGVPVESDLPVPAPVQAQPAQ